MRFRDYIKEKKERYYSHCLNNTNEKLGGIKYGGSYDE